MWHLHNIKHFSLYCLTLLCIKSTLYTLNDIYMYDYIVVTMKPVLTTGSIYAKTKKFKVNIKRLETL